MRAVEYRATRDTQAISSAAILACLIAAGLALIAWVDSVIAVDLNAPINTTPTVGTEIKRGMDAAFQCPITVDPLSFSGCIFNFETQNRQKVVDYQPFDLGLFFEAWALLDSVGYTEHEVQGDLAQKTYVVARGRAASMYKVFRSIQQKLGVTDEQLVSLSSRKKEPLAQRLEFWSKLPTQ